MGASKATKGQASVEAAPPPIDDQKGSSEGTGTTDKLKKGVGIREAKNLSVEEQGSARYLGSLKKKTGPLHQVQRTLHTSAVCEA